MIYPITYGIPDHIILKEAPQKTTFMAPYIPGMKYCYDTEEEYLKCYKDSVFGLTQRKNGWDCWRHVEIMSQGCFPYMLDIDDIPRGCMYFYPKEKMKLWMDRYSRQTHRVILKNSSSQFIFDINDCLEETRSKLSGTAIAKYVCSKLKNPSSILYIPYSSSVQGYLDASLIYGLKHTLGKKVYESITRPSLYTNYPVESARKLYGRGMNCTRILDPSMENLIKKEEIIEKIKEREFDAIFWANIHESIEYLDIALQYYDEDELGFLCEQDDDPTQDPVWGWTTATCHMCHFQPMYGSKANFFVRELDTVRPYKPPSSKLEFFHGMAQLTNMYRQHFGVPIWTGTQLT